MLQRRRMLKRQRARCLRHLCCGTPDNTLSFHTRAFLIHSVFKYQSLTSENICVRDLVKSQGKYKVSTKYILYIKCGCMIYTHILMQKNCINMELNLLTSIPK